MDGKSNSGNAIKPKDYNKEPCLIARGIVVQTDEQIEEESGNSDKGPWKRWKYNSMISVGTDVINLSQNKYDKPDDIKILKMGESVLVQIERANTQGSGALKKISIQGKLILD